MIILILPHWLSHTLSKRCLTPSELWQTIEDSLQTLFKEKRKYYSEKNIISYFCFSVLSLFSSKSFTATNISRALKGQGQGWLPCS